MYIGNTPLYQSFVTDTFSGNGSTTAFTMSVAPANTPSVLVAVSGVLQDPSTYSVSGTTLTFSGAPPTGTSNISVRYLGIPASGVTTAAYRTVTEFTATAGQTTFSPASYTVGYIDVYRNGVKLGAADYTATNGTTVVLALGATAGDLITTISFFISSIVNAIPATTGSISSTYIAAGAVGSTQLDSGAVTQAKLGTNVAGNGPAFSAYLSTNQTVSFLTLTKIQCQTEEFDTNSNYDSSTNYRFTPTVAGYYQVNAALQGGGTINAQQVQVYVYKNGAIFKQGARIITGGTGTIGSVVSALVYCNGTTDYLEAFGYVNGAGTALFVSGVENTYFQAFLARSA